jgi:hypothetical protein
MASGPTRRKPCVTPDQWRGPLGLTGVVVLDRRWVWSQRYAGPGRVHSIPSTIHHTSIRPSAPSPLSPPRLASASSSITSVRWLFGTADLVHAHSLRHHACVKWWVAHPISPGDASDTSPSVQGRLISPEWGKNSTDRPSDPPFSSPLHPSSARTRTSWRPSLSPNGY